MSSKVNLALLETQIRQLDARPGSKRYRTEDDIRVQLINDINGRILRKREAFAESELTKDESAWEEGQMGALETMVERLACGNPRVSRDTGWFIHPPLTVAAYNHHMVSLTGDASQYATRILGWPKQNVVRGVYQKHDDSGFQRGAWYFNAVREGSQEIWAEQVFHEDDYAMGGRWDNLNQLIRYNRLDAHVMEFLKTSYVHDSYESQYREGWEAARRQMNYLASKQHSLALTSDD